MPTWDELYADPTLLPVPDEPEPFVTRALDALPAPRSTPVLDVGCGAGRHLLWLERHGFTAFGTDRAANGLGLTRELVRRDGHAVRVTLVSTRAWKYGEGRRLEPSTYVQERGPEAGLAHHYCDEAGARALLAGFDVDGLALDEFSDDDGNRHSHWRFVATRRGTSA